MSSVTLGFSPQSGQLGLRFSRTSRNDILSASMSSSRELSDSPMPKKCFKASVAWMLPTSPVSAPSTPASAQLGTIPGGGGEGNRQR